MKHLAAYLLLQLAERTPDEKSIKSLLDTVGIEADSDRIENLLTQLNEKDTGEVRFKILKFCHSKLRSIS